MTGSRKKGLILFAKRASDIGAADPERLVDLLNQADGNITFDWGFLEDAEYILTPQHISASLSGTLIEDYDVVYFRFWGLPEAQSHALALARYCDLKHVPFVDSEVLRKGSFNKINQYINLFEASVPFPSTVICSAGKMSTLARLHLKFPFVVKDARGTRGNTNFLVESQLQLETIAREHSDKTFVLQQYIANKGDYRVFVTGSTAPLIIYRQAKDGSYLNNTSQGGGASIVPVSAVKPEMIHDAIRAAAFFGRDIAGVDVVLDADGSHYCFEVNRAPQIEHSSFEPEKASVVAAYLSSIVRDK